MSVFDVTPGDATNQGPHLTITPPNTSGQNVNVGDTSSAALQPGNQTTINPDGSPMNPAKQEEAVVVLDGPLGRAYTQALNLVYANESTGTMVAIANAMRKHGDDKPAKGTFVYAMTMDELEDHDGLGPAWEWMQTFGLVPDAKAMTKEGPKLIISLECIDNRMSRKAGLVEELARSIGAEVVYTRDAAFRAISKSFKK
jgi:hypothetical protein